MASEGQCKLVADTTPHPHTRTLWLAGQQASHRHYLALVEPSQVAHKARPAPGSAGSRVPRARRRRHSRAMHQLQRRRAVARRARLPKTCARYSPPFVSARVDKSVAEPGYLRGCPVSSRRHACNVSWVLSKVQKKCLNPSYNIPDRAACHHPSILMRRMKKERS